MAGLVGEPAVGCRCESQTGKCCGPEISLDRSAPEGPHEIRPASSSETLVIMAAVGYPWLNNNIFERIVVVVMGSNRPCTGQVHVWLEK